LIAFQGGRKIKRQSGTVSASKIMDLDVQFLHGAMGLLVVPEKGTKSVAEQANS